MLSYTVKKIEICHRKNYNGNKLITMKRCITLRFFSSITKLKYSKFYKICVYKTIYYKTLYVLHIVLNDLNVYRVCYPPVKCEFFSFLLKAHYSLPPTFRPKSVMC